MIGKPLFFIFFLLPCMITAQAEFKFGVYTSNLQLDLKPYYYEYEAYRTNPARPSLIGLDLQLDFQKGKRKKGIVLQLFTGNYWYTEKPTYTRVQGQVVYIVDRKAEIRGFGLGYIYQYTFWDSKKADALFKSFSILSQSAIDLYRIRAPYVPYPYKGMYSLELREIDENALQIRQFIGMSADWTYKKYSGYIYAGADFNLDLWGRTFRPNYRFGLGYTFKKAKKSG
ncbi:MAG TPA: hypothetical protein DIW47_12620 [Bacteroidetes bacterium]|nr:hypothetical protein [Bacteroidota bacterium]